jgi:outer membrane protein OmpA-like peptidoglycan-associated protein
MKLSIKALFISLILICTYNAIAQNPKRTKIIKKEAERRARIQSDQKRTAYYYDSDSDKDGVLDINDKCPGMGKRGEVTPFGCPLDRDFDGVYDAEDHCIDVKGPKENFGCPWPDTDGDGILDKDDECLTVKGELQFHGCPDTDGDGIRDLEDNCPTEKGTWALRGCPPADTDKDGIPDAEDLCPKTAGVHELRGCPPLKQEEKDALKKAFDNLLFETGSDVIIESSYPSLIELAKILINNPATRLRLEGHTDDVGDDNANLDLSRRRAASVEHFLESKGVPHERITSAGYGETRPKLPNTSEGNRKINRRVEMLLSYE